jgi:hypothetical protein
MGGRNGACNLISGNGQSGSHVSEGRFSGSKLEDDAAALACAI